MTKYSKEQIIKYVEDLEDKRAGGGVSEEEYTDKLARANALLEEVQDSEPEVNRIDAESKEEFDNNPPIYIGKEKNAIKNRRTLTKSLSEVEEDRIIRLKIAGFSVNEISDILGRSWQSVNKFIKAKEKEIAKQRWCDKAWNNKDLVDEAMGW